LDNRYSINRRILSNSFYREKKLMDLITIIISLLMLGILILLGGFLIIGIFILIYLAATGNRWD
ncbi:MAG: hypothetical protein ACXACU_13825, partial [Candidatus Hodarchaeales archaeon]